ncbi:MAG: bifunctional oligoribonuclease/PAP phosphatase NrnA [Desulfatiglans sp.]|jgi:phosphoesterase RecJ-like protein|nr:bifunctional oligoribonuclease/PAP phosphatase NrnA [Thermodesulfobacteriota bacterium]MEE4351326.1 bifunctional oligoribonuclease/PAP phosphatase NrnA [Desulfatiglans sp.]
MSLNRIATVLTEGRHFLIIGHKDPDADAIGSMLALGKALSDAKKEVVLLTEHPLPPPYIHMKGAHRIVSDFDPKRTIDFIIALDCSDRERLAPDLKDFEKKRPLVNIDHHASNDAFGDLNLVDPESSSTGELVYRLIKAADLPLGPEAAENIFSAIQTDTGSFRYNNTTPASMRLGAEMMEYGVKPWEVSRRLTDQYSLARLKLLEMALHSVEFHYGGRLGMMTLSLEMFEKAGAQESESERFVDYPRFVSGVEIAVLIRQTGAKDYKFSLRSNDHVDVSALASRFGGGGHMRAAGFELSGSIEEVKQGFLREASLLLNDADQ